VWLVWPVLVFYVSVTRSHINLHAVQIEDDLFYVFFYSIAGIQELVMYLLFIWLGT
jgi:hypothetical protein